MPAPANRFYSGRRAALLCLGLLAAMATNAAARLEQLPQQWRDDQGRTLVLGELLGHRVFLSMAYTRCRRVCPTTMNDLQRLQQQLDARGEQASIVIVGFDPDSDDPQDWRHYRAQRKLERSNWYFLTGTPLQTRQLAHQLGFDFWTYDTHVMHDSRVVVFDQHGLLTTAVSPVTADWSALF
jgi:cytochrome oxidase Cu insertion factor (SCO1/SenC/PrrC family)